MKHGALHYHPALHTHIGISAKWQRIILLWLLAYEGAGAILGGMMLIASPDGRLMDMPVDIMNGVFKDFFVPGIILLALGVLNAAAFITLLRKAGSAWLISTIAMGGLLFWFITEIAILQRLHWLHAMWGLPVVVGSLLTIPLIPVDRITAGTQRALLICGIISSVWYVAMNLFIPLQWPGYNSASQVVSELSAIGAPTRLVWMLAGIFYTLLTMAFGYGVWRVAGGNQRLRVAGALLLVYGAMGFVWPFAPMHLRETLSAGGGTFSDTMHIVLGAVTDIIYLFALGFAAAALGKTFRVFSVLTVLTVLIFGLLTFSEAGGIGKNLPTPFVGLYERVNIGVFLLWMVVLAVILLKKRSLRHQR